MKVTRLQEDYYQVEDGNRWWTAKYLPHLPGSWHIENRKGREVSPTGLTGRRVIAEIEKAGVSQ